MIQIQQTSGSPMAIAPPAELPPRLFGLTIDSIGDHPVVITKLTEIKNFAPNNPPPIVRIVLDMENGAENVNPAYFDIIKEIRGSGLAYIMLELVDSDRDISKKCIITKDGVIDKEKSKSCYRKRAEAYFNYQDKSSKEYLKNYVDIWEIGNEINGDWFGDISNIDPRVHRDLVLSLVGEAYKVFVDPRSKIKRAKTAVTFYFNDDGDHHSYPKKPSGSEYSMLTWIDKGQAYFKDVDYVFISYYEDDNFDSFLTPGGSLVRKPIIPEFARWADIFKTIHDDYPLAKFGFGEFGPQCHCKISNCENVIDPDNYKDPNTPKKVQDDTCPKSSTEAAWKFHEVSDGLWKRICPCCHMMQLSYIGRYYADWDAGIGKAINDKYGLASYFAGGYFYWHFNPDVLDKYTFAHIDEFPKRERESRMSEAETTLKAIKDAYKNYTFQLLNLKSQTNSALPFR